MNAPTFRYIEDYIEFIAGYRDTTGKPFGLFETRPSTLSLARYDVSIVDSMASQTAHSNKAYTDKQAALAKKIVLKYKRQLAQLSPPVFVDDEIDQYRLGIRIVDRSKRATVEDGRFVLRFPYDTKLIDLVKAQSKSGNGSVVFDHDDKVWYMALTESNLNWIVGVAPVHAIELDEQIQTMYENMLAMEKTDYKIELVETDAGFAITNASDSLVDYINEHLGGFAADNLLILADNSPVLGYTLSESVQARVEEAYGPVESKMICARQKTYKNTEDILERVLQYAAMVNRLPIHVYATGTPNKDTENIIYLNRGKGPEVKPKLLVSMSSLMIGSKKESWIANAEKIITLE